MKLFLVDGKLYGEASVAAWHAWNAFSVGPDMISFIAHTPVGGTIHLPNGKTIGVVDADQQRHFDPATGVGGEGATANPNLGRLDDTSTIRGGACATCR